MVKTSYLSIGTQIFTGIIIIYLLVRAYLYTINLGNCNCFNDANLKNISLVEYIIIALSILNITLSLLFAMFKIDALKWLIKHVKFIMGFATLYIVILLGLMIYFVYLINDFRKYIDPKCGCSNKWERYVLYIQALYYTFFLFTLVFGSFFVSSLHRVSKK